MKRYNTEKLYKMVKDHYDNGGYGRIKDSAWEYLSYILYVCGAEAFYGGYYSRQITLKAAMGKLKSEKRIHEEADSRTPIKDAKIKEEVMDYIPEFEEVIREAGGLVNDSFYYTAMRAICRGNENEIREGVKVFEKILKEIQQEEEAEALTA